MWWWSLLLFTYMSLQIHLLSCESFSWNTTYSHVHACTKRNQTESILMTLVQQWLLPQLGHEGCWLPQEGLYGLGHHNRLVCLSLSNCVSCYVHSSLLDTLNLLVHIVSPLKHCTVITTPINGAQIKLKNIPMVVSLLLLACLCIAS